MYLLSMFKTVSSNPISHSFNTLDKVWLLQTGLKSGYLLYQNWEIIEALSSKKITKISYCRSPLEGQQENVVKNFIGKLLFRSELMHHEIILQVEGNIYILVTFGMDGIGVYKQQSAEALLKLRKDNTIEKDQRINRSFGQLIDSLEQIAKDYQQNNKQYSVLFNNCQKFASFVWSQLINKQQQSMKKVQEGAD